MQLETVTVYMLLMLGMILLTPLMSQDSIGGVGDDCSTANLSCAMDYVKKPAICDSIDNICYTVDVSNTFSSLPLEQASMAESGF